MYNIFITVFVIYDNIQTVLHYGYKYIVNFIYIGLFDINCIFLFDNIFNFVMIIYWKIFIGWFWGFKSDWFINKWLCDDNDKFIFYSLFKLWYLSVEWFLYEFFIV